MDKPDILFDSRSYSYKNPTGAVQADTNITFTIKLADHIQAEEAFIVVHYDRHSEPAYYLLRPANGERTEGYETFTCSLKIHDTGLYWYNFMVKTPGETFFIGRDKFNRPIASEQPASWQQTVYRRAYPETDWIYGGIFYHAFVDRFHSSGRNRHPMEHKILREDWGGTPVWEPTEEGKVYNNDFFGGDLEGIRQKLPYLSELGVTCIYLSPVFEAFSNHKYDTGDYEKIDAMFGSEEDFRALCSDAEKMGMRIICDGVFSHTGSDSLYFDRYGHYGGGGAYNNPDSPYRSWYYFHDDGTYDSWWDFDTLPKLNKLDPGYTEFITGKEGIIRRWLEAGASGWRLDVADELPVAFLDKLVASAKETKEDAMIIGEVWEDASNKQAYDERKNYFEGNRLDSVMNYPFRTAIIQLVRYGLAQDMAETVESIIEHYPEEVVHSLMNLLGTHDSPRIITALAGKDLGPDPTREQQFETRLDEQGWEEGIRLLKMASLLQMTLPGVPCIYYGDEAGTEGYKDPFNRTCYPWNNERQELLNWYRKITDLRRTNPVFSKGRYKTLAAVNGFYAFKRSDDYNIVIIAVNCGQEAEILELPPYGPWTDRLSHKTYEKHVTLEPGDMLFLQYMDL